MRNRFSPILVATLAFGTFAASRAANYALVVGVNQCNNYVIKGQAAPDLLAGAADAKDFENLLKNHYKFPATNVHHLLGEKASYKAIKDEFAWFHDNMKSSEHQKNQFVFYFAGHGTQIPDLDNDEADGKDEALCMSDSAMQNGVPINLVVDDELAIWLERIPARNISLVFDCCHAGTAAKGGPRAPGDIILERSAPGPALPPELLSKKKGRKKPYEDFQLISKGLRQTIVALYACGAEQPAIERTFFAPLPIRQRGQFTELLIENIRRGKSDHIGDLSASIKNGIDEWANEKGKQDLRAEAGKQKPEFEPADKSTKNRPLIL